MARTVVVRNRNGRNLRVEEKDDGSLAICGHDMGPEVESFFGSDEYEWCHTIPAVNIARLRELLAVPAGVDLLDHLEATRAADEGAGLERVVREHDLASSFWSWP